MRGTFWLNFLTIIITPETNRDRFSTWNTKISQIHNEFITARLVHLNVEDCFEELLRQQSYAIKNQLRHLKPPY